MAPLCLFCGEVEHVAIAEIRTDGNFILETCCEDLHYEIRRDIADDPAWGRDLLRNLGAEELTGHRLRRVHDGQCGPLMLDFQLVIGPVTLGDAQRFIARHHGHCDAPHGWRYGASIWNGSVLLGVVTVGNPVARAYNGRSIVEVNRLCIRRDTDAMLRWNACSMLYGYAAKEAARRGFARIITYTRKDEPGTSLVAAGWVCEGDAGGGSWHSACRARSNANAHIPKMRWSRTLRPSASPLPQQPISPATAPEGEGTSAAKNLRRASRNDQGTRAGLT